MLKMTDFSTNLDEIPGILLTFITSTSLLFVPFCILRHISICISIYIHIVSGRQHMNLKLFTLVI